ncbi:MAG: NADH-quinone oxidoreductase subunit M [Betaproteobacteria bacterium AqS2]|uniref:NADH-quinone oxidoreductase subunit M n=1 Tax=Candidatus Amphirhobacter heronislandensis TaxID=1732024 RepID=A0A930XWP1_9GAMM|nr:NADH-quinone oxidoreductase subunit M [Betaproteobacteria bacterium AqS2]
MLSLLIWTPIFGGLATLLLARDESGLAAAKFLALLTALLTFCISVLALLLFNPNLAGMQLTVDIPWITALGIDYALGVDGIALALIVLNCAVTALTVLAGWNVKRQPGSYLAAFLLMCGFVNGVFSATDAALFYVFWEATLIPLFLVIGVWGGERRVYAAIKFFLYTFCGSILMLVAFIWLYDYLGSFDILLMHRSYIPAEAQPWIFFAFLAAFAVKIPMVPVHTWLPDAHVEAPTGGSIILAAIMLKLGGYGLLRLSLPIVPDASVEYAWLLVALSLVAIIYIGLVALAQTDMKKLVAYSSVAHMGFVTLGTFIFSELGLTGAVYQMISHGFISGAMFFCIGVLYDRMHTRNIGDYGGVANTMPRYATLLLLFAMANAGLPGTSGFVGEFMVVLAAVKANLWWGILAATALITGAAYSLWMYKRAIFGAVANDRVRALKDVDGRELTVLAAFAALVLLFGVWPLPITNLIDVSVAEIAAQVARGKL